MTEGVSVNLKTDQYKLSNLITEKKQLLKKLTEIQEQWDNDNTTTKPNINIISGPEKKCIAEIQLKKKMA